MEQEGVGRDPHREDHHLHEILVAIGKVKVVGPAVSRLQVTGGMVQTRVAVMEPMTTTGVLGSEVKEDKVFLIAGARAESVRARLHLNMTVMREVKEANGREWTKDEMHHHLEIADDAPREETSHCTNSKYI